MKRADGEDVEEREGHKYEVQQRQGIGRWVNERGKSGPLPVLLDWTFLERNSFFLHYSHFPFLIQ